MIIPFLLLAIILVESSFRGFSRLRIIAIASSAKEDNSDVIRLVTWKLKDARSDIKDYSEG
jgi:hypothetical protein